MKTAIKIVDEGKIPHYQARCFYCKTLLEFDSRSAKYVQYSKTFTLECPFCYVEQCIHVDSCTLVKA